MTSLLVVPYTIGAAHRELYGLDSTNAIATLVRRTKC